MGDVTTSPHNIPNDWSIANMAANRANMAANRANMAANMAANRAQMDALYTPVNARNAAWRVLMATRRQVDQIAEQVAASLPVQCTYCNYVQCRCNLCVRAA
jgi:tetrahydromethanopterin S-methyltransferase subunit H